MNKEQVTMKDILLRWQAIIISVIVFALIAFTVSVILPAKYQSDVSMIVIQEQANEKVDAFSATKSAEFLSNIFTRVIYTTTFFNAVQDAPFDVRRDFSRDPEEREKEWEKFIDVKKVNNTGIINISVFDQSRKTAEETAKAIAYTLTTNSEEYHGGGNRVTVRLIDGPSTPLRPTIPRILPNTLIGALFGLVFAIVCIYFFPNNFRISEKKAKDSIDLKEIDNSQSQDNYEDNDVIEGHFKNVTGAIEFDKEDHYDPEVNALHDKIESFNKS